MFASRIFSAFFLLLFITGCASMRTPMTDFATDYNRVIADTRNEMILLNIVRARQGEPTHYSALSTVQGNVSISGSVGASLSNIIDGDTNAAASTGISVRSGPSFTVVPLASEEFSGGILRPIAPNVIALFRAQGWSNAILTPLFVERVGCAGPDGEPVYYYNDPRRYSGSSAGGSRRYLTAEQAFNLGFESEDAGEESDEPVATIPISQHDALELVLERLGTNYRFDIGQNEAGEAEYHVYSRTRRVLRLGFGDGAVPDGCQRQAATGKIDQYSLRSVEGIIYFLGEALRGRDGEMTSLVEPASNVERDPACPNSSPDIIFRLSTSSPSNGHAARINHRGQSYYVAMPDLRACAQRDRSIQIISLISQLIGLQTSSEALERAPSTLTIN